MLFTCSHCCLPPRQVAYKSWLCVTTIPFYKQNQLVRPCNSYAEAVEIACPYLSPHPESRYAGEPAFLSARESVIICIIKKTKSRVVSTGASRTIWRSRVSHLMIQNVSVIGRNSAVLDRLPVVDTYSVRVPLTNVWFACRACHSVQIVLVC